MRRTPLAPTALTPTLLLALAALLPGCASKLQKATRTQAAADFQCSESEIELKGDEVYGKYYAAGCGQKGVYSAQCLMGKCSAEKLKGE